MSRPEVCGAKPDRYPEAHRTGRYCAIPEDHGQPGPLERVKLGPGTGRAFMCEYAGQPGKNWRECIKGQATRD